MSAALEVHPSDAYFNKCQQLQDKFDALTGELFDKPLEAITFEEMAKLVQVHAEYIGSYNAGEAICSGLS